MNPGSKIGDVTSCAA